MIPNGPWCYGLGPCYEQRAGADTTICALSGWSGPL
jgi:hypothetical protein